jgi:iron uptake system EfeUOB component EfeO/EfeM
MLKRGALLSLVALAGCGGSSSPPRAPSSGPPVSSANPVAGSIPKARPRDFAGPIAIYRRHVRTQLGAMLGDVARLRAALARGDRRDAERAWLAADARYESIGAAYGAFGDLDGAINGLWDGLPGGVRSPDFTGLHRVELALWGRHSVRDAIAPAARLTADVRRLRAHVARMKLDPFEYALRSHEVLEDTLHLQLSGRASPWAGAALTALRANVAGTRVVLGSLKPLIARRNPLRLHAAGHALARLERALPRRPARWDALPQRRRERIAGLTAAAAEQLAFMPELVDPRPPVVKPRVFGS